MLVICIYIYINNYICIQCIYNCIYIYTYPRRIPIECHICCLNAKCVSVYPCVGLHVWMRFHPPSASFFFVRRLTSWTRPVKSMVWSDALSTFFEDGGSVGYVGWVKLPITWYLFGRWFLLFSQWKIHHDWGISVVNIVYFFGGPRISKSKISFW